MAFDENGNWVDSGEGDLSSARPIPSDWPGGSYGWTIYERERLRNAGIPTGSLGRGLGEPAGRFGRELQESFLQSGRGRDILAETGEPPTVSQLFFGAGGAGGGVPSSRPLTAEERERLYGGLSGVLSAQERRAADVAAETAFLSERPYFSGLAHPSMGAS